MEEKEVLQRFAENTSVSGLPRIISSRSRASRWFWSLLCILASIALCVNLFCLIQYYLSFPTKFTIITDEEPTPFPSVTVCNMRNLDVYVLNEINKMLKEDHQPKSHLDTSNITFINKYMALLARIGPLWLNYQEELNVFEELFSRSTISANIQQADIAEAAIQLETFLAECFFGGFKCNVSSDFYTFFDPQYYNCFTYTPPSDTLTYMTVGQDHGWSAEFYAGNGILEKNTDLRVLPGLQINQHHSSAGEGLRVVVHPPGTTPYPSAEGFDVPVGFSARVSVRPWRKTRAPPPYGSCSDPNPVADADASFVYQPLACQEMCAHEIIIKHCNCIDNAMSNIPVRADVPFCRSVDGLPDSCMDEAIQECLDELILYEQRMNCTRDVKAAFLHNHDSSFTCNCPEACDENSYDLTYSLAKWPATGYQGDIAAFNILMNQQFINGFRGKHSLDMVSEYMNTENREEFLKDFVRLNIYLEKNGVRWTREEAAYSFIHLLSDIGGQMALWVGISIISLAELLELCVLLCQSCRRKNPDKPYDGKLGYA